jgi:hypothetical protein
MLESLSISSYVAESSDYGRENASSADDQQERLVSLGWVIGFVDGEGCFSLGLVGQPDRPGRKGYVTGYQVFHEFAVTQGAKSLQALEALRQFFGVGKVYGNRRHDNHREDVFRYVVRKRSDLLSVVIPFFKANPLRTSKRFDFELFAEAVKRMEDGRHRTPRGLIEILELASRMNRQKPRTDLIRILRDQTPDTRDTG